jgi:hypothetical protein
MRQMSRWLCPIGAARWKLLHANTRRALKLVAAAAVRGDDNAARFVTNGGKPDRNSVHGPVAARRFEENPCSFAPSRAGNDSSAIAST